MTSIIEKLQDKDTAAGYGYFLELERATIAGNELYPLFDDFLELINHEKSYVRVRGFRLCCALAQWDTEDKLGRNIDKLLVELEDEKPTAVRQCLAALHQVLRYKPELRGTIEQKLDLSQYKDSMRPLIEKDIERLREL